MNFSEPREGEWGKLLIVNDLIKDLELMGISH